ncbi:MAG: hypothetical protein EOM31_08390 [Bacteroidia bacterium]|nr:hypothetical protein [Bacteroidia bacterium]
MKGKKHKEQMEKILIDMECDKEKTKKEICSTIKHTLCSFSFFVRKISPLNHEDINMEIGISPTTELKNETNPNFTSWVYCCKIYAHLKSIHIGIKLKMLLGLFKYGILNDCDIAIFPVDETNRHCLEDLHGHYVLKHEWKGLKETEIIKELEIINKKNRMGK